MTDTELRAHELATAFTKDLHQNISARLDENTLEFMLSAFADDYQTAYDFFISYLKKDN